MTKSTKGTQLTWMDTWVKRLIIFRFSFLYSTHMDVGYPYALQKLFFQISNCHKTVTKLNFDIIQIMYP